MFIIKYLKSLLYIFILIILFSIIIGTLNYFNIFSKNTINILELIATVISIFIGSLYLGRISDKKGYLEGIKIGILVIVILLLFKFLGYDKGITWSSLIYYLILLISSILGSVIGINKKSS